LEEVSYTSVTSGMMTIRSTAFKAGSSSIRPARSESMNVSACVLSIHLCANSVDEEADSSMLRALATLTVANFSNAALCEYVNQCKALARTIAYRVVQSSVLEKINIATLEWYEAEHLFLQLRKNV
jgi:hypothetical protein